MRGGEKTLAVLASLFADAPIYTLLARWEQLDAGLRRRRVETSWLQKLAFVPDLQRKALPVLAAAARSLDARSHDVVICSDAAIIKAIRTRPDALKLCYCHSPMRYIWDLYDAYYARAGFVGRAGLKLCAKRLRRADYAAAQGVAGFVANSRCVADRIRRNYGLPSVVIPPPVDTDLAMVERSHERFYLVVSELVSYKRVDLAVDACTRLNRELIVVGTGPLLEDIRHRAGSSVRVLGWQDDAVVRDLLGRCRALLFCGEEDFGMTPVEAQAAGRPVIAYRAGGVIETVRDEQTGVFFDRQVVDCVADAIERFEGADSLWMPEQIQEHAQQFSIDAFCGRFMRYYQWCMDRFRDGGPDHVREAMRSVDRDAFV